MTDLNRYQTLARKALIENQSSAPAYMFTVSKMDRDNRFAEYRKLDKEIVDTAFELLRTTDATEIEQVMGIAAKKVLESK